MKRETRILACALLALLPVAMIAGGCSTSRVGLSGAEPASKAGEVELGSTYFASYCVNCHGSEGEGDGPLASLLKIETPDLTKIALRYGGVFPLSMVREKIDGSDEVQAHGSRTMPVWGVVLDPSRGTGGSEDQEIAQAQINELLEYVRSIQVREYR